jgi:tRNA1Val (adenine37-N6)-methyltransferase
MSIKNSSEVTEFLDGELKIRQGVDGYRFSVDAVLLANFVDAPKNSRIADFGTGSGIIPLVMAYERGYQNVTGIEIQSQMVEYAAENVTLNRLENKIKIIEGDFCKLFEGSVRKKFDAVVTNPPYKKPGTGKINPDSEKAIARHELKCNLHSLVKAASTATIKKGNLYMIYHPHRLDELISELLHFQYHVEKLQMVHSYPEEPASLFMMKAVKNSKKELLVEKPVYVYGDKNEYSEYLRSILKI